MGAAGFPVHGAEVVTAPTQFLKWLGLGQLDGSGGQGNQASQATKVGLKAAHAAGASWMELERGMSRCQPVVRQSIMSRHHLDLVQASASAVRVSACLWCDMKQACGSRMSKLSAAARDCEAGAGCLAARDTPAWPGVRGSSVCGKVWSSDHYATTVIVSSSCPKSRASPVGRIAGVGAGRGW